MQDIRPLISIITITRNAAGCVAPTMRSVAEQKSSDIEHLLIDGASTDDTLAIARRVGIPGLRILSEPDRGLYDAMNKGLRLARGQYLLFLNAGDRFASPDILSAYAAAAQTSPQPDIIYADTQIVDALGNVLRPRHLSAPALLTTDSYRRGMLVCHQAFMVRAAIAPEYDMTYQFSADYDWCLKCIRATTPERCINLHRIAIDYLDGGLTNKNHLASLRERFHIMRHNYGLTGTLLNHIGFVFRALGRRYGQ